MNKIKFIYFDIGGVLVRDFSKTNKWDQMMRDWGVKGEKKEIIEKKFDVFEDKVNLGKNVEEFIPLVEKMTGISFPKKYSFNKDFVDRFEKILV